MWSSFCLLAIQLCISNIVIAVFEPTRPANVWDPFETTSPPPYHTQRENEVTVRLSIGDVVGKKTLLSGLPWSRFNNPLANNDIFSSYRPEINPPSHSNNVSVFVFLSIPYAQPPVSERRFKPPQQLIELPGSKPYLAFHYAPSCAQDVEDQPNFLVNQPYPFSVSEDCLYLSIFTPEVSSVSETIYPVIVFLHGGNYQTGSANDWPAHVLASYGVVVVTVNYRLGPFGFMSLGDKGTGNYGLQDQRMALRFIKQHVASFRGDPQSITLVGHDAGAVSVGLHMLDPLSKNLFRSVSAMSGAEVSYHSVISKPVLAFNNTIKLGRYLGCTQIIPQHVWNCILTRSTNDILQAVKTVPVEYNRYLFLPNVDGNQIPAEPLWMLNVAPSGASNIASPVPYLTGLNRQDGSEVIMEDRTLGEFNDFMPVDQAYMKSYVLEYAFRHNYSMNREATVGAITSRYTYWPDPSNTVAIRDKFVELATDAYYVAPISLSAHLHSAAGSRVFMYINNYEFSSFDNSNSFPPWLKVCHNCDLFLLFGFPFLAKEFMPARFANIEWTASDRNASLAFMNMFVQFAKNMNPSPTSGPPWTAFEPRAHWYFNFSCSFVDNSFLIGQMDRDYRWEQVSFWNEYVPSLVQYMTTTFSPIEEKSRRELVALQTVLGIVVCILMLVTVLACVFAYLNFERTPKRRARMKKEGERIYFPNEHKSPRDLDQISCL